jgi:hypothetical protein
LVNPPWIPWVSSFHDCTRRPFQNSEDKEATCPRIARHLESTCQRSPVGSGACRWLGRQSVLWDIYI